MHDKPIFAGILATDATLVCDAQALAMRYAWRLLTNAPLEAYYLQLSIQGLSLQAPLNRRFKPLQLDFTHSRTTQRANLASGATELMARALGIKRGESRRVLDLTAGLGSDAYIIASLGCEVELWERCAPLVALLERALDTARCAHIDSAAQRMQLHWQDSVETLRRSNAHFDLLYMDPMYPPRKPSATRRELYMVREIAGDDIGASQLFHIARQQSGDRLVVKRARHAPPFALPDWSIDGNTTRFDVYRIGTSS